MKNGKVSIIIVNYNGVHFLKKCLSSIKKQTYKNIEIILVDNNSHDGSIAYMKKIFEKSKIIKNNKNLGFAKPNNQGAKIATGEYLFLLNNDTELFKNTIEKLLASYIDKSILTARQISLRDKSIRGRAGAGSDIFGYPYVEDHIEKTRIFYADGAALFIKKKDFIKIGMFDEELYMFQEDIDFSWRAQIMGYKIIPCWNAKLYHYYGGTAQMNFKKSKQYVSSYFRRYMNERNIIRNILKNYSTPFIIFILAGLSLFHLLEIILFSVLGKFKVVKCYFAAYKWNIKKFKSTMRMRKKIQQGRIVPDIIILKHMYFTYAKLKNFTRLGIPSFE